MKLTEFEGKTLFATYGIPIPNGQLITRRTKNITIPFPCVIKAQVLSGNRNQEGGILFAQTDKELREAIKKLFNSDVSGQKVKKLLIEEAIDYTKEYYVSLSYDTDTQGPVLSCSTKGGSGISKATTTPFTMVLGLQGFLVRQALKDAGFPQEEASTLLPIILKLWSLMIHEYALLVEINPLFKTKDGQFIAGDAKIVLDDEKLQPAKRRFLEMPGDIAILASGGGASLVNIDALLSYGGKPANYTEYSGNPKGEVVQKLTTRVLSRKGLKGCWVVGGTANFTDIYETMKGFIDGLRQVRPKPTYPIVIRRDGPRQKEAFEMLREVARKEGYDFHLYGSETPMAQTAKIMVGLAYK